MNRTSPIAASAASARRIFPAVIFSLTAFTACHAHAADAPRATTPSMAVEIEDRGADRAVRVAKLTVGFVNGQAKMKTSDGDARYEFEATVVQSSEPFIQMTLHREQRDKAFEMDIRASIAAHPSGRVVVARLDRADGGTTVVTAHVQ